MNRGDKNSRIAVISIILLVILFVFLDVGVFASRSSGGVGLFLIRLLVGFLSFLTHNLSAISFDSGTWGPGIAAYLAALSLGHRFLSRWASRSGRPWSFATTFCVFLILPVLFGISFLVPGVLLQWDLLRQGPWIQSQ